MKKQRIRAKVADLVLNEGQLEWLPKNPRQWTREDVEKTRASLRRDPDFQEDSPLKVIEYEGKLLVFAGNLRTTSAREEKWETFEAILYTPENEDDRETIKRRAILDNGSYGSWDYDILANEWDDMPLCDFGVPAWHNVDVDMDAVDALFEDAGPGKEKGITITISVPKSYEDKLTDIEEAIDVTLEEFPGCTIK
jgi:hypothetical protein